MRLLLPPLIIFALLINTPAISAFFDFFGNSSEEEGNTLPGATWDVQIKVQAAIQAANEKLMKELGRLIGSGFGGKPCVEAEEDAIPLHNWGGNFNFSTMNIQYPRTVAQVQHIVKRAKKLRVIGSRHSFSKIADSSHTLLSTLGINGIVSMNATVPSITVQPGISYTDMAPYIDFTGFALSNLAALAEISVGGGIQTASHGSSLYTGNLATQVRSMQMVLANGTLATFGPGSNELKALSVGLGAFGVITQVELMLEKSFNTTTYVFQNLPTQNLYDHLDEIEKMGYSVHAFTTFANKAAWNTLWVNVRSDSATNPIANLTQLFGATRSYVQSSTLPAVPPNYFAAQNVQQPWYNGLVGYRFGLSGANGNEVQTELFVPYSKAVPALKAVANLSDEFKPVLSLMFIRVIKSDDLWMSQSSSIGTNEPHHLAIHFSWQNNVTAISAVLPKIEQALMPFGVRPHWGKFFTMKPKDFLKNYPKLEDFKKLAMQLDPNGKFRNKFLDDNVFV